MSRTIAELREASDDDLIREHDEIATNSSVGVGFYVEELDRRSRERSTEASVALARRGFWLGVIGVDIAILALAVAVVTLLVR